MGRLPKRKSGHRCGWKPPRICGPGSRGLLRRLRRRGCRLEHAAFAVGHALLHRALEHQHRAAGNHDDDGGDDEEDALAQSLARWKSLLSVLRPLRGCMVLAWPSASFPILARGRCLCSRGLAPATLSQCLHPGSRTERAGKQIRDRKIHVEVRPMEAHSASRHRHALQLRAFRTLQALQEVNRYREGAA